MRIRQTRVFLWLVTTLFCTIAFASTGTDQAGDPTGFEVAAGSESVTQEPLLLAKGDKVTVCHFLPNGKYITQELPEETAQKLIEKHPHEWILGDCDDVVSPS